MFVQIYICVSKICNYLFEFYCLLTTAVEGFYS